MVKRGEIYMTDLGEYKTSVEAGTRPCVIVSNNVGNHYSPFVLVCPLTGVDKKQDRHACKRTITCQIECSLRMHYGSRQKATWVLHGDSKPIRHEKDR